MTRLESPNPVMSKAERVGVLREHLAQQVQLIESSAGRLALVGLGHARGTLGFSTREPVRRSSRWWSGADARPVHRAVGRYSCQRPLGRTSGCLPSSRWTQHPPPNGSGLYEVLTTLPSPRSEEFLKIRWRTWTTAELVARATATPLVFEPGTKTMDSNTNYLVLGMIVERATGHSYPHEIEHRIIRPGGLPGTARRGTDPFIHGPHAHGYLPIERDGSRNSSTSQRSIPES
jgi:hypothetical protein